MSDYVPTTEQVRNNMAFGAACAWVALHILTAIDLNPNGDTA